MQNRQAQRTYRERKEQEIKRLCRELAELKEDHKALQIHTDKLQLELEETRESYQSLLTASMPLDLEIFNHPAAGVDKKIEGKRMSVSSG